MTSHYSFIRQARRYFKTHKDAPRILISNSQLVPKWATWEHFDELEKKGLMMYGQMTAGSWIYIGSQESCRELMRLTLRWRINISVHSLQSAVGSPFTIHVSRLTELL
jgi:hypothetical protein